MNNKNFTIETQPQVAVEVVIDLINEVAEELRVKVEHRCTEEHEASTVYTFTVYADEYAAELLFDELAAGCAYHNFNIDC